MVTIVEAQRGLWFVVLQPIGFLLYLVTGLMQSYRAPFLEPFAPRSRRCAWRAGGWSHSCGESRSAACSSSSAAVERLSISAARMVPGCRAGPGC